MPLLLDPDHPSYAAFGTRDRAGIPLRVGIVNVMPKIEAYEPSLLGPLSRASRAVGRTIEPVFLRLESHGYASSDHAHLDRFYRTFGGAIGDGPLDGIVLTGAPVEELPFAEVRYWRELVAIFGHARRHVTSTLGLCWGGLALAGSLGVEKVALPKKLFGVFGNRVLEGGGALLGADPGFVCAQSRHSGIRDEAIEDAARSGVLRPLSHAEATGYVVSETPDHAFVMHLGHPEYEASRLVFEWERDRALGRADVPAPADLDLRDPVTTWRGHREGFFAAWVALLARGRPVS